MSVGATTKQQENKPKQIRDLAIDRFRGALVILMVVGNYLSGIAFVPTFLKHAPDIGLTVADLVAPAFVFVIGLNIGPSFARRIREGRSSTYRHLILRYLGFIGIGAVISAGSNLFGTPTDWGVLQALGVAGILCLAVIHLSTWLRLIVGLAVLIGYQVVLDAYMLDAVLSSNHGGLFGSVSWAALLILSTVAADFWKRGNSAFLGFGLATASAALLAALIAPISKHRISVSYVLISLAICIFVFLLVKTISDAGNWKAGLLSWWGQNALYLYLAHLLVLGLFVAPGINWWYSDAPAWLAAAQLSVALALLSLLAWRLGRVATK